MNKKYILIITLLLTSTGLSALWPVPKLESMNISDEIPRHLSMWRSEDLSEKLMEDGDIFGDIFARVYVNQYGESLLFIILDAGNFHNPKVCYGNSGFNVRELDDTEFQFGDQKIKASTIFFQHGDSSRLLIYWLCVDKKIAGWGQQKLMELHNSFFNGRKTRLMVRVEIPTSGDKIAESIELAKSFLQDIYTQFPQNYVEYVFGRHPVQ